MPRHNLQPTALSTRIVQGHVLYSHVVVVEGRRTIFIAGQLARDRQGNMVGAGDMRAQIRQVGENLKAALAAAGATLNDLVKTTTYVTDIEEFFKHVDVRMDGVLWGPAHQYHGRSAALGPPRCAGRSGSDCSYRVTGDATSISRPGRQHAPGCIRARRRGCIRARGVPAPWKPVSSRWEHSPRAASPRRPLVRGLTRRDAPRARHGSQDRVRSPDSP